MGNHEQALKRLGNARVEISIALAMFRGSNNNELEIACAALSETLEQYDFDVEELKKHNGN